MLPKTIIKAHQLILNSIRNNENLQTLKNLQTKTLKYNILLEKYYMLFHF